ncbi:cuticle protein 63-like [Pseudomyrmex gracilis]|uniref:cuticle protein 63-like n=1 Tax=Pseudomyrmex gracilis TaxID=219809 RepID=UPI000995CEA9|nr:cuticle protein 63-like [Pseudomyrmex gracilis]
MFKLAVFLVILAVAFAAPGGLTGVAISAGTGPIVAPAVAAAPALALAAHAPAVIAQPIAPAVHTAPVVTRTVLAGHAAVPALALHG